MKLGGWENRKTISGRTHVLPVDDLKEHLPERCWCRPVRENHLVIHNSMDGREDYETGKKKVN